MRLRALPFVAALVAAALVAPSSAAPSSGPGARRDEPAYGQSEPVNYILATRHGDLFLEVVHPTLDGKVVKAPVVLTYTPYSALGRNGDASRWTQTGYARATADVVGTGNSGGCYDYGGRREKETGYDLVEWIAAQEWASGKVGMIGGSYDGTTATATAIAGPPHLATIVPEAAISRWYEYAYSGGMRYVVNNEKLGRQGPTNGLLIDEQGFDTPIGFDFGFAGPPPTNPTDPRWAERTASSMKPCDEVSHILNGYDSESPDYTGFWQERDYIRDAGRIRIPVLVSHNWGDWNVKQEEATNLFHALTGSRLRRLYMGTRWNNHGVPGGEYQATVQAWMDRWLKGTRNNIERTLPEVVSQTSDAAGPGDFIAGPFPRTSTLRLTATSDFGLSTGAPGEQEWTAEVAITGTGTESRHAAEATPGVGEGFVYLESPVLTRDVRLFGSPVLRATTTTGREWLTLTPSVLDIDDEGRGADGQADSTDDLVAVTRGWLDTRYAQTLARQHRQPAGRAVTNRVVIKPQDYIFRAGHRIGLIVATDTLEWTLPKAYDGAPCASCAGFRLALGRGTTLELPLVTPGNLKTVFSAD